jgi:hypothetical protein
MPTKAEAFPSRYLSAPDLKGGSLTLKIRRVTQETLGRNGNEQVKTVLSFDGGYKALPLNRTNWDAVVDITGEDDSDNWPGHLVEAYESTAQSPATGTMVPCVRLRSPPQGELKPQGAQPTAKPVKARPKSDMDDPLPEAFSR